MRGLPSTFVLFFFGIVFLIELISFFSFVFFLKQTRKKKCYLLKFFYLFFSISVFCFLFYSFSNSEIIRHSRSYKLFYWVVALGILDLVPKFFWVASTLLSLIIRPIAGLRSQIIFLTGSFIFSIAVFFVIVYGITFGRENIEIKSENIFFDNLPVQLDGLRICQISDIHLGTFGKNTTQMDELARKVESLHPDLLLFTGDIVNNFSNEIVGFESVLTHLHAPYGKFAILGNHDYGDYFQWPDSIAKQQNLEQIKSGLMNCGFQLLLNQNEQITVKDTSFTLIGVENWGHKPFPQYADLKKAMYGIPEHSFKILMSHDPAHWDSVVVPQTDIPLTLSGHTHGGQFGIKLAGIEFSPIYFIQKHWGGLYMSENQYLYVNRGFGTIGFIGRVEMRPEITILTLHRSKNH